MAAAAGLTESMALQSIGHLLVHPWNTEVNSQAWTGGVRQALPFLLNYGLRRVLGGWGVIIFGCVPTKLPWVVPCSWSLRTPLVKTQWVPKQNRKT